VNAQTPAERAATLVRLAASEGAARVVPGAGTAPAHTPRTAAAVRGGCPLVCAWDAPAHYVSDISKLCQFMLGNIHINTQCKNYEIVDAGQVSGQVLTSKDMKNLPSNTN